MAVFIPDEIILILVDKSYFELWKNAAGNHPGLIAPSAADGIK